MTGPYGTEASVTPDCFCGTFELSAAQAYMAAVQGLIIHGEVLNVEAGASAMIIMTDGKMANVRLMPGFQIGQVCWCN